MSITYWLNSENKERCFTIYRKGTVFEKEPAYITAYEICKGLNALYASKDHLCIPLRDAQTGKLFIECPTADNIDKMIKWLREKHDIFYYQAMNLCIPLEDPLSRSVKKFWEEEDAQQKQIEDYCKNDVAVAASKELGSDGCTVCKGRVCDQFIDILNALGVKEGVLYPPRGQSKVECFAKLANERAQVIFKENQTLMQQVDSFSKITAEYKDEIESLKRVISGLNIRVRNQSSIIKTQNESLTKQRKQLKDLGVALGNVKNTVDCEIDTLMSDHGDEIIPEF